MTSSDNATPNATAGMPVFYSRPEALNPDRHSTVRLVDRPGFDFARTAHSIPIMAAEMPAAMRSYPIVFVGDQKMPIAITGFRRDQNLFVEQDGTWSEPHYVPAYVRRYPFVLAGDESDERLTLCIDRDSDRISDGADGADGALLFENGVPSQRTQTALDFCQQYQTMLNATKAIIASISSHNLFAERQSKVTLPDGTTLNLTDFSVIDEAALNGLQDDAFLDLRKAGALPLIYCHLASMNSWTSLLHQSRAAPADASA